ncbi:MAG: nitroreductase family protein [Thermoplasmatota archaeon]
MEFKEVVRKRRSVRKFKDKSIPQEEIKEIIEIGHMAPSAGNLQARDFIVVSDEDEKKKLSENAYGQKFIAEVPWVIVVCANKKRSESKYGDRGRTLYSIQDATAAVENMLLAIVDKGYASVWVGAFNEEEVSNQLKIPKDVRPVAIIPIGYPARSPKKPSKMNYEEVTHYEMW